MLISNTACPDCTPCSGQPCIKGYLVTATSDTDPPLGGVPCCDSQSVNIMVVNAELLLALATSVSPPANAPLPSGWGAIACGTYNEVDLGDYPISSIGSAPTLQQCQSRQNPPIVDAGGVDLAWPFWYSSLFVALFDGVPCCANWQMGILRIDGPQSEFCLEWRDTSLDTDIQFISYGPVASGSHIYVKPPHAPMVDGNQVYVASVTNGACDEDP